MRSLRTKRTFVATTRASLSIGTALALVVAACVAWSHATPAPGQRSFAAVQVWTAWCAAIGLWACAHAALFGGAMPALYQARPIYTGIAALCGLTATFAGVTWTALLLARA